jgi:hypothetical protein
MFKTPTVSGLKNVLSHGLKNLPIVIDIIREGQGDILYPEFAFIPKFR